MVGYFILLGLLLAIAWEDIRYRTVHVYWFIGLAMVLIILQLRFLTITEIGFNFLCNMLFLVVLFTLLHIYYCIKARKLVRLFDRKLGLGDVVMLVCLSGVWALPLFVLFMIGSLCFSLIAHLLWTGRNRQTVPLAGLQAISFGVLYILERSNMVLN